LAGAALVAVAGFGPAPEAKPSSLVLQVAGKGEIVIQLREDKAPLACAHVSKLAERGFYDGQRFFRVAKEPRPYLIQFGDPATKTRPIGDPSLGKGGSGARIPYEDSGLPNVEGAVGLSAQPGDRDSGDSQFYILLAPARFLDGSYTVFGNVTKGMDVVKSVELGDQVTSVRFVRG
jgi:cyclophilin family peptidyl-prolyl cis-trans isomerase